MHELLDALDRAEGAALAAARADLAARTRQARRRLRDPHVRVLVVGELNQGKSLLVNALVGAPVCPVDDDVATSVPTAVGWAAAPTAAVLTPRYDDAGDDGEPRYVRSPVPLEALPHRLAAADDGAVGEVGLPRQVLTGGLVLVDTPGVGGIGSTHGAVTMASLPSADAVLLVSDAAQEYTAPELEFLEQAVRVCPNVACVLTKTDLHPHWRTVADLDRAHLERLGLPTRLMPVSSTLRLLAARRHDRELHDESGFPALVSFLRDDVADRAGTLARRSVGHDVTAVVDHLLMAARAECETLADPAAGPETIAGLEHGRQDAAELRRRSARWQQVLADGAADLSADIEYDLRDRLRRITREAEEAIDREDPGQVWEEFDAWLAQRVRAAVAANAVWAHERAAWLAEQVARQFATGHDTVLPELAQPSPDEALELVGRLDRVEAERLSVGQKAFVALKGSYGGVLMFGMVTAIALGMSLINPISVGIGVVLGGKAYREDRLGRVRRRRTEAKAAVRRHLDEVAFQVSKDARDRLRGIQRVLRDHFTTTAEELVRSLDASIRSAQRAAATDAGDRAGRLRDARATVAELEALRADGVRLAAASPEAVTVVAA